MGYDVPKAITVAFPLSEIMTELLQRAITEISKLSDEQQDAIAIRLLAELEDEQVWQAHFETTLRYTMGSFSCFGKARHCIKRVSQRQPIYSVRVSLNY